jgi:hypothetical protein
MFHLTSEFDGGSPHALTDATYADDSRRHHSLGVADLAIRSSGGTTRSRVAQPAR